MIYRVRIYIDALQPVEYGIASVKIYDVGSGVEWMINYLTQL